MTVQDRVAHCESTAPAGPVLAIGPTERPNRTMRTLDGLVRVVLMPLAKHASWSRQPVGPVDHDLPCRVSEVETVADGVVAVSFVRVDGTDLPTWFPGAHVDVVLPERLGGMMRQYSLTGEPRDRSTYRIGVRRIGAEQGGRGGSAAVHALRPGDRVTLKGPRHAFPLIDAESYLFVAGGIGITAILPMVRAVVEAGDRPWRLIYTGRTRASMPFLDEIGALASAADEGEVLVWPDDETGIPDGRRILAAAPVGAALYTCGPPAMIEAIRAVIPDPTVDTLHYERFSPAPVRGGSPFTVRLARSGAVVRVGAEESALAAVLRTRPEQAYSCQQGFCGTCRVRVLVGTVDHRDGCLTPYERETQMMLCVSRGDGEVVIDG